MKITNKHPVYASDKEREKRLADMKARCREKLSARPKTAGKVS